MQANWRYCFEIIDVKSSCEKMIIDMTGVLLEFYNWIDSEKICVFFIGNAQCVYFKVSVVRNISTMLIVICLPRVKLISQCDKIN